MTVPLLDPTAAAEYFFAGARNAGLSHVVLSPGSRSTPLTIAVSRTPELPYSIELDERVAAFVALGMAKVSGQPVGLVCTSGTAAANYLPAVAEAAMSNVPLVVITADRPPEHQRWGVGQSFDQRGLYQRHVRDEITMPVGGDAGPEFSVRAGWRATATAIEQHGPVHVNWAFRMPLEPATAAISPPQQLSTAVAPIMSPTSADISSLSKRLEAAKSPLIIAGPDACRQSDPAPAQALLDMASALGIPVIADVLSGIPVATNGPSITSHALLGLHLDLPDPDLLIHVGQTPTAKPLRLWWETLDVEQVLIDPLDEWQDPSHSVSLRVRCALGPLMAALTEQGLAPKRPEWLGSWQAVGEGIEFAVSRVLGSWPSVTEAHIARALIEATTPEDRIVASSSMPVRDLDMFAPAQPRAAMFANRGINGIDGVVSTASGIETASSSGQTYVLIGDIASLHDVGGILAAARNGVDLTIVIPNNDGGGIFSFLPIKGALAADDFDELLHTPHGTNFAFLGEHQNITYLRSTDPADAFESVRETAGIIIVEIDVNTPDRLALQAEITASVKALSR